MELLILYYRKWKKKKFDDYKDLESRAGIKEPVNHLSKRIIEEISGETQFRLFVKK